MVTDTKVLATAAADWWANFLREPDAEPVIPNDHSLGSFVGFYIKLSNQPRVKIEQITLFKAALIQHLEKYGGAGFIQFYTDYAPEWPLSEFLRNAGIANTYFPSMTTMTVDFENGEVRCSKVHGDSSVVYPVQT